MSSALESETGDLSSVFNVTQVCELTFSVQGTISSGSVDIQFSPNNGDDWYVLDSTNLSFSAVGQGVADWGECQIRAAGNGLSGSNVKVWIGGTYVHGPQ